MLNVDHSEQPPSILSLCTGYGGIERGLEQVFGGLRPLAYVETEAYAIACLLSKMEQGELATSVIWTNLKTLPCRPFRKRTDILTAGFNCQPFSSAGKRESTEDSRYIYPYIGNIITKVRPTLVFLENVEGIINAETKDKTSVLLDVLRDLESRGYIPTWGIFSASEVGTPHRRKRVFILAYAKDQRLQAASYLRIVKTKSRSSSYSVLYPSPKGCEQYEWEAPRTKPRLGRTADGSTNRIDRLRLLGNGVVPETVELAFKTLYVELFD